MKKTLLFFALILIYNASFSQISFESGYLINDSNEKIECLIKNNDWKNNPSSFEYKLTPTAPVQYGDMQSVKEFMITNSSKFIRATVPIDESSITKLDEDMNPKFVTKQIFLKVLVEGKASLYSFENKSMRRYFYAIDGSEIEQLVYKKYKKGNTIGENKQFTNQLNNQLICSSFTLQKFQSLSYNQKDLESIFIQYNECTKSLYTNYGSSKKSDLFHLTIRPGMSSQSLVIENPEAAIEKVDFGNKLGFRIGVEAEFILPFNRNKWSFIMEPTYQTYEAEKPASISSNMPDNYIVTTAYKSVELPIGFRYYMYFNEDSKLFVNLSYITDFSSNSMIEFNRNDGAQIPPLEIKTGGNFGLGAGYQYKKKLNVEFRYHTAREVLGGYHNWNSKYETINLIFGYTLF